MVYKCYFYGVLLTLPCTCILTFMATTANVIGKLSLINRLFVCFLQTRYVYGVLLTLPMHIHTNQYC